MEAEETFPVAFRHRSRQCVVCRCIRQYRTRKSPPWWPVCWARPDAPELGGRLQFWPHWWGFRYPYGWPADRRAMVVSVPPWHTSKTPPIEAWLEQVLLVNRRLTWAERIFQKRDNDNKFVSKLNTFEWKLCCSM